MKLFPLEFSSIGNDMYWKLYDPDNEPPHQFVTFSGYSDHYWWNNVAPEQQLKPFPIGKFKYLVNYEYNFAVRIGEA